MKELPGVKFDWCEYIGQRICFEQSRNGILRYYGEINSYDGSWFGIELDEATGENDGSINGVKYFTCEDQHGIFIPDASNIDVVALTQVGNKENLPLNHFEFGMFKTCVDQKTFNPLQTDKISFISTVKENLFFNTSPYFSNQLMVPKVLPCVLSPLKEESENYIDSSDLNLTTDLKYCYGDDQESLMKTFTLKDNTFDVGNSENVKEINLIDNDKDDSNLTGTDDSLGILPSLLNDSSSWDCLTYDAKSCNENHFSNLADSLSLKNTPHQTKKVKLACMTSLTVAFHTGNVKEDSVTFSDVDSPLLDCENLPVCASTPKHEIIFTNFNKKSTGLDVPKNCSALAVSGDCTLGHKEQIFSFSDTSTVEDFNITFVQSHSERPCLNTSYDVSKKSSKDKLFQVCEGENIALVPDAVKAIPVENILKSTLELSTNVLNSTFVHQDTVNNSGFVCGNNNGNCSKQNQNDITTANNLNQTFRMNEEKVTKQKISSINSKLDSLQLSEYQKVDLQCTFTAKHFDCIKESLSNDCQKKKDIKLQSKLPNPNNLSKTIKKTTNLLIPNKDRFSLKWGQTKKSSSSEPCRKNNFIKTRRSLSSVSDLKHSISRSLDDKNKSKCRRSSLLRVENKSYSLLNSTITIPKSISKNLHSEELSENCSSIPDSIELHNSIGSGKGVMTSDFNSLCDPNLVDIPVFLSEEPVGMKPNGEDVNVDHRSSTKPFHGEKDLITFSSGNENKKVDYVLNSETCFETDVDHTGNYADVSEPLVTNVAAIIENKNIDYVLNSETLFETDVDHTGNYADVSEPLVTNVAAITEECCPKLNTSVLSEGNDEECVKNVLNESIVCTHALASTNQLKQSMNALNSKTVTKKGSYKEFANSLNTQNLKTDLSTTLCSTSRSDDLSKSIVRVSKASSFGFAETANKANSMKTQNLKTDVSTTFSSSVSEDLSKTIVRKSKAGRFGFAKNTEKASSLNAQNLKTNLSTTFCSMSRSEDLSKSIVRESKASALGFAKNANKANSINPQNLKTNVSTTFSSTSRSYDLSKPSVRKSTAGSFGFAKTTDKASSMNTQNLKPDLSATMSRSEDLNKFIVGKSKAGTFDLAKTTDEASSMKNKLPKLFGLAKQSETSKVKICVRQSTGSVSDSTCSTLSSTLRMTNSKTSNNLGKHNFNQKDLAFLKNSSGRNGNFVVDSAKIKVSLLPSKKVVEARASNCVTDSVKDRKAILPSKKGLEAETSKLAMDYAKGKKASILPFKKVVEAGTSNCVADTNIKKHSQQQNLSSAPKKESCVVKTSIKCPVLKLKLEDSSRTKPINRVCKVNSEKPMSSKFPSSKNDCQIMPVKNNLRPNIQPPPCSIRTTAFKKEDKNVLAPSKGNVQRKSAENFGLAVSKQGLKIPKLFNKASTGCEKNAGNVVRKLKSPCQQKKAA